MKPAVTVALLLALSTTAGAQDWVQSVQQDVKYRDAAVLPNGEPIVLSSLSNGEARLERYTAYGTGLGLMKFTLGVDPLIYALESRPDGTVLLSGSQSYFAWIGALDQASGSFLWETTTLQNPDYGSFNALAEGPSAIFAGGEISQSGTVRDGYLTSFDPQGTLLWQRRIGPFDENSWVEDLVATDDGGVLAAVSVSVGSGELHLVKLSSAGNLEWAMLSDPTVSGTTHLELASDGNVMLARAYYNGDWSVWLQKLTEGGSILWEQLIPTGSPLDMVATLGRLAPRCSPGSPASPRSFAGGRGRSAALVQEADRRIAVLLVRGGPGGLPGGRSLGRLVDERKPGHEPTSGASAQAVRRPSTARARSSSTCRSRPRWGPRLRRLPRSRSASGSDRSAR